MRKISGMGRIFLAGIFSLLNVGMSLPVLAEQSNPVLLLVSDIISNEIMTFKGDSILFSPDGKTIVISNEVTQSGIIYDLNELRQLKTIEGVPWYFSPDGQMLLVKDLNSKNVHIYDATTWTLLRSLTGLSHYPSPNFNPDGKISISYNEQNKSVSVVNVSSGKVLNSWNCNCTYAWGSFSPDGKTLAVSLYSRGSATADNYSDSTSYATKIYRMPDFNQVITLEGYYRFSPSGKYLYNEDYKEKKVTIYNVANWNVKVFNDVRNIEFGKDDILAAVSDYEITHIYSTVDWSMLRNVKGSSGTLSPDGKLLILKQDKKVKWGNYKIIATYYDITLQNTLTGEELNIFKDVSGAYCRFSPNGKFMTIENDENKTITLYNISGTSLYFALQKGEFESTTKYHDRIRSLDLPYSTYVVLRKYDADRGAFEADLSGNRLYIPMSLEKAKLINKDKVLIEGRLKYNGDRSVHFVYNQFVDGALKQYSAGPTSNVDQKQFDTSITNNVPAENIQDIPDFKSLPRKDDFAVVMGVERYQSLPNADYSKSDAGLVKDYLKALGFQERNIEFLTDERATKSGIEKSIEAWLPNRVKKDSRVFIYYSGHGSPDPASGEANLVPYDGDPNYLSVTGYPINRLYDKLGKLQVKEVIIVLDACFSGAGGRSVLAKGTRPIVMVAEGAILHQNMAVLTATQGTQISTSSPEKGHGLLTYYFLKAIKDGKSDIAEIYELIKPQIEDDAKMLNVEQSPSMTPAVETIKGKFSLRLN